MGADPMVPDLAATPTVVRKRRAPKHDFKDGKGKVFAHRHDNGGGWVADTAYVAPGVKVTRNAQVFDYAKVYDSCKIMGSSRVFGHARLFDSVELFKDARVHAQATLGDTVQVHDSAIVAGNARVFGGSRLHHRVLINGDAYVYDTFAQGPGQRMELTISGTSRVLDSRLYGYVFINDSAMVDGSTLRHACVTADAKIVDSQLTTDLPWQDNCVLDRPEPIQNIHNYRDRSDADVLLAVSRRRCVFQNTAIDSTFVGNGVHVGDRILFINARMHMRYSAADMTMPDAVEFFQELGARSEPVAFCNIQMVHDVSELRQYLLGGGRGAAAGPVTQPGYVPGGQTAPAAASVPNLETIRQRRLQRLEGE